MILLLSFALAGVLCSPRLWRVIRRHYGYWKRQRAFKQRQRARLRFVLYLSQDRLNAIPRK